MFAELPNPARDDGTPRLTGVEIELGGLDEAAVAATCVRVLGGRSHQAEPHLWKVTGSSVGDLEIVLDTALTKAETTLLRDLALRLGRDVIPVEIVTEPLERAGMEALEPLVAALREAGARGSGAGVVYGFGVHFNPEIASKRAADVIGPLLAYALIEDWLRWAWPIDESRRILPFTAPYPTAFVRDLIALGPQGNLDRAIGIYLDHCPSRNHGLDMLPLFAHLRPGSLPDGLRAATGARPTFHFRLPDCLIDDPGWSLAAEWLRWVTVERVAADADLVARLCTAWSQEHGRVTIFRQFWAERCGEILGAAGIGRG